jgi:hypothetical protein
MQMKQERNMQELQHDQKTRTSGIQETPLNIYSGAAKQTEQREMVQNKTITKKIVK